MIIHLTTHIEAAHNDVNMLKVVLKVLKNNGHTLARDWLSLEYLRAMGKDARSGLDWGYIYKQSVDAIEQADLVIAESSDFGCFGVGYQAALAVQKKKPLLILQHASRIPSVGTFPSGIDDHLVKVVTYDDVYGLASAVQAFIDDNSAAQKDLRFNFVIDKQIQNHLKWRSFKTGKTKAEVVRDLLQKDMEQER